jgi:hypothetical protein
MFAGRKSDDRESAAPAIRFRASRRAERLDMIVASTLLVLLIFGYAVRLAPFEKWPSGDFLFAVASRHV